MSRTVPTAVLLLALPFVVYWSTIFHEYGLRDDYAHLREVRERPGWITELTTANGRPVYGFVLERSVRAIEQVDELPWLRLAGTLFVALVGVLLWAILRRRGWPEHAAAAYGALIALLPGAQVIAGWAIAWPIGLGLVTALAAFALVDVAWQKSGGRRMAFACAGVLLYLVAGLTYQTSALFALAPLAALLLASQAATLRDDARFAVWHVGAVFAGLLAGWLAMNLVFAEGLVREAARMQLEPEPLEKLLWFIRQPLPNALALFVLRDRFMEPVSFWVGFCVMVVLVAAGLVFGARTRLDRWRFIACLTVLPILAHSVSLAASSQAIGYRTLLPMAGIFLAVGVTALRSVVARSGAGPVVERGVLAACALVAAVTAGHNAYELIAVPQGREWQIVKSAVADLDLTEQTVVYVIRPSIEERSTERVYTDEFGSVTADADWAAREMFKAALRQRFPGGLPVGVRYAITTSFYEPTQPFAYDLVIDMRRLKALGDRARAAMPAG